MFKLPNLDLDFSKTIEKEVPESLIKEYFPDEVLKALFYQALSVDIMDNNARAEIIKYICEPYGFDELGTGTNRIGLLKNNFVFKIALDRRGIVDNFTEFKRSAEMPRFLAKSYETNMLILCQQYVNVMDQEQFIYNEPVIKDMLSQISSAFIFDDIGFTVKNSANYGYIETPEGDEIRILDYGYLYPLTLENKTELFRCPRCGAKLEWDRNYTRFECNNPKCRLQVPPHRIIQKMANHYDKLEMETMEMLNGFKLPDLINIESTI